MAIVSDSLIEAIRHHCDGDLATASTMYRQILRVDPQHLAASRGLARIMDALGRSDEAVNVCHQTLEFAANDTETLNHLACLQYRQGDLDKAAAYFKQALESDPQHVETWLNLGSAFVASSQLTDAEHCFRSVTEIDSENTDGWLNLSNILKVQHRVDEAADAFQQAARRMSPRPLSDLWTATLCPPIFQDNAAIDCYREQLRTDISQLTDRPVSIDLNDIGAMSSPPPINLPFHGRDDRELLEAFAGIFQHSFPQEPPRGKRNGQPRIGFIVTSGHEAIFLRFLGGTLNNFSSPEFDTIVICPETSVALLRQGLHGDSMGILPIPYHFASAVERIRDARFDVLYHWETGTDVTNYFLPFCRLARVQCTSMGNAETSGIAAIDYFISSKLYEPAAGHEHYTEKLILLDGLGSLHSRVSPPPTFRSRESFGFSSQQHLYVCAHKLQKIHPDFDPILADILRSDPQGIIVLVEDEYRKAGESLRYRFCLSMPDVADRVQFTSRLDFPDYLSLLATADVLLDPLHYGGGLTTYDAISLNRPVVTLPGQFARGRYTAGMYQKMEMNSLIADSPQHYAELAVRLATEPDYRESIESTLRERSAAVFNDTSFVAQYQRIFEQLVAEARSM